MVYEHDGTSYCGFYELQQTLKRMGPKTKRGCPVRTDIAFEVPDIILEETLLEQAYLVQEHIAHLRKEIRRAEAFHSELLVQARNRQSKSKETSG